MPKELSYALIISLVCGLLIALRYIPPCHPKGPKATIYIRTSEGKNGIDWTWDGQQWKTTDTVTWGWK